MKVKQTDTYSNWLDNLKDASGKFRIISRVNRIEEYGILGDTTPVGDGVSELRLHFGPGYRIYYIINDDVLILLLCGGDKSSQKRDIKKAILMANDIRKGDYNEEDND
jgi:putative addiction module killer protein